MKLTYMLVGWEGSSHDARVLQDARSKDFKINSGHFYVADAGYALEQNILVPYQETRYHLQEQAIAGQRPANKEELFNLRHSSLRNASKYHLEQQYDLVFACACIHNINVIRNSANDIIFQQEEAEPSNNHTNAPQINNEIPTGCYSSNSRLPIDFYDPDWFNELLPAQKFKAANICLVTFLPDANQSLLGKQHEGEKLCDKKFVEKYWEELTKPYNLTHKIKPIEDESSSDSKQSNNSSYCGKEVVLSDTSGKEESDDDKAKDNVAFIDDNSQDEDSSKKEDGDEDERMFDDKQHETYDMAYEDLVDDERKDKGCDQLYQMMLDEDDAVW
ncbi:hypothetical protein PCANC_14896 [Puccinia coronata f. sp. avenae]|uniref:DDE Tnp4 domain-containing protein n=1 Tax=Puccinia coronata f. sp. avenae TaxID=200324 RepID=A0A2N5UKH2_9BASI|nr:hypothetical protein PCANC_14896 [Puccinia coronata f. sp. avenae]